MKRWACLALVVACTPFKLPESDGPAPIITPRPLPPSVKPLPTPVVTPAPTPTPEPVKAPTVVKVGQPFVVTYCGPEFMENVAIRFDGKYEAGGLMGWADGCKRQTIDGLTTAGSRYFEFVVDGQPDLQKYDLIVED